MNRNLKNRLIHTVELLEKHQGGKHWNDPSEPLDSLMLTILSQNTNDKLRDRAYSRL
jgi:endonuclease III